MSLNLILAAQRHSLVAEALLAHTQEDERALFGQHSHARTLVVARRVWLSGGRSTEIVAAHLYALGGVMLEGLPTIASRFGTEVDSIIKGVTESNRDGQTDLRERYTHLAGLVCSTPNSKRLMLAILVTHLLNLTNRIARPEHVADARLHVHGATRVACASRGVSSYLEQAFVRARTTANARCHALYCTPV